MTNTGNMLGRREFIGVTAATSAIAIAQPFSIEDAFAVTSAEKKAEAQAALEKLNVLQEKLDIASADYFTAVDEQEKAKNKMTKAQKRIKKANKQITDLQGQISTRVRSMYRTGSSTFLDILLGSTSFQAFSTNWDVVNSMNDNDTEMVKKTKKLRNVVRKQKEVYSEQEAVAAQKAKDAERIKKEAESLVAETQATYNSLSAEAERLLREERAAAEEAQRRQQEAAAQNQNNNNNNNNNDSNDSAPANTNDSKSQTVPGSTVVERAYNLIGKPYGWGCTGPNSFDCSGLVSACLAGRYGVRLGTTYTFMGWTRVSNPQPGDICTNTAHCGIYIGGHQMIHAPQPGESVKVGPVQAGMIYVRY